MRRTIVSMRPLITSPRCRVHVGRLLSVALSSTLSWRRFTSARSRSFEPILTNIRGRYRYPLAPPCFPLFPPHLLRKRWHVFYEKIHFFPDPLPFCHVTVSNKTVSALFLCPLWRVLRSFLSCPQQLTHWQSPGFIPARSAGASRLCLASHNSQAKYLVAPRNCYRISVEHGAMLPSSNIAGSIPRSALPILRAEALVKQIFCEVGVTVRSV